MINLIIGPKGTGKTKHIIKLAQDALDSTTGNIVFIDNDSRTSSQLSYNIRFINSCEFDIKHTEAFFGFISGLIAGNYDIQKVYVDGLYNITDADNDMILPFLLKLDSLSEKYNVDIYIAINATSKTLPEGLHKYIKEELKLG